MRDAADLGIFAMEVAKCHRNLILRAVRRHSQPLGGQAQDRSRTFSAARSIAVSSSPGQRPWVCRPRARAPFGRPWGRPQRQWLRPPPARARRSSPLRRPSAGGRVPTCRTSTRRCCPGSRTPPIHRASSKASSPTDRARARLSTAWRRPSSSQPTVCSSTSP